MVSRSQAIEFGRLHSSPLKKIRSIPRCISEKAYMFLIGWGSKQDSANGLQDCPCAVQLLPKVGRSRWPQERCGELYLLGIVVNTP
jgi:hypothetical protein